MIKLSKPKKSVFDLTHDVKMSCKMGNLYPVLAMEAVPGDKFDISCESLIRMAPMIAPVMHRMDVTIHYFFVPNRIVWSNWEKFITNTPALPVAPTLPLTTVLDPDVVKFYDYMGIPAPGSLVAIPINALPFAAYQCIYNEYYRDQNLITPVPYQLVDGDNSIQIAELAKMRIRAYEHDYFTAALPFAQKGAPVEIPFQGDVTLKNPLPGTAGQFVDAVTGTGNQVGAVENDGVIPNVRTSINGDGQVYNPLGTLEVNGGTSTINDLRRAYRLQEWLEKNARGGTRYIENILTHFGVRSSDSRLQRPEYITGVKNPIVISEVLNTAGLEITGTDQLPQGNMSGHGVGVVSGRQGSYYCEEHGWIMGIMSILPRTAYQQGIQKQYLKTDPLDYFWPSFANIGEQEVLNKELFIAPTTAVQDAVFGYVPRYAEYKYFPSRVAGDFKTSLNYWHLGRIFTAQPGLNQAFIECKPEDQDRIFAVADDDTDYLYCHVLNKIKAIRPMPYFGTPMM